MRPPQIGRVLLASALVPPYMVIQGRRTRWMLLSLLVDAAVSVTWYILWWLVLMLSGC
jgi:hypothetical protein